MYLIRYLIFFSLQREAALLLVLFAVTATADISLISAGTSIDEGYLYPKPNVPFDLPPPREVHHRFPTNGLF